MNAGSQRTGRRDPETVGRKRTIPDKEKNQIAWVRAANQHRAIAEEIILKELIYV